MLKTLPVVLLLITLALPGQVNAQDLEPRRWSHLPSGMTIVGVGYAYTDSFVYFSPFWKITDTSAEINSFGISAIYTFDMAGKSARVSFLLPYVSGRWEGDVDNKFEIVKRHGFADPRLRLSVNLYGAPALKGAEYTQFHAEHENNTVVGASLAVSAPLGQYYEDELINISANRWTVRPQIGVVHSRGPWAFELTGSVFLFSDNKNFVDNALFEQKTMYAAQAHVTYDFRPGLWISLGTAYGAGGRVYIEDQKTAFEVDNWLWAASFGFPIGKTQSVKLTWLSGRTQNDVGRDSDNLLLSWSMRWIK
ncbi:MAG: transporter [Xanthomonadales bacterium]|nr:transporter [Xanthomonadales bacterium]MDH4017980.1 transporter [Xanthomonadales bacterium]